MYKAMRFWPVFIGSFLMFILAQAAVCQANDDDSRYLEIADNANYTYYLDTESAKYITPYPGEVFIDAWIKIVCTSGNPQTEIEDRLSKNLSVEGYENFGYSLRRYYFRLNERQMQMMDSWDFTVNGVTLNSQKHLFTSKRWDDIVPTTLPDTWYTKILAYMKSIPK